jgi:hypothetical protein
VIWIGFAASMGAPSFFILFGLVFCGVAIFSAVNGAAKANAHQSAEALHLQQRSELIRRIEGARQE